MITHVLDTSAVLAHYLQENGAEEVNTILRSNREVGVSVLSLVELWTRLVLVCADRQEAERAFRLYANEILVILPVGRDIVDVAIDIRQSTRPRVPLVDSIIAATARVNRAILVHRDPHLGAISQTARKQIVLPEK